MIHRQPAILHEINCLRDSISSDVFRIKKLINPKARQQRLKKLENQLSRLNKIEQFCRTHIPEDQWKGVLG